MGLTFGVVMTIMDVLIPVIRHHPILDVWWYLIRLGFYVVGFGGVMGVWSWQNKEREYKSPTEDE
jgi:hypothetical protein